VIKGIAQGLEIEGEGMVEYTLTCDDGSTVTIRAKAYFVPDLGARRLISPQGIRSSDGNPCVFNNPTNDVEDPDSVPELHIMPKRPNWRRSPPEKIVPARYHPLTKLPTAQASIGPYHAGHQEALAMSIDVTDTGNANLSDAQKTLLMLHYRLGHVGLRHIQWMIRTKKLSVRNAKNVEKCELPKCAACLYAKMRKRPTQSTHSPKPRDDKEMNLRVGDLLPGQRVSVDHFESSKPGRMYSTKGGSKSATYCGGAIFVDHATGFISVQHQQTFGAADTIKAKLQFERAAYDDGVIIQDYHTDNGVFTAQEFLNELVTKGQRIRFAGSGAAHQNGVAERSILTITGMARTMLLHAALRHGGSHIHQDLWPQAIDHAVWLYNRIPRVDSGLSPMEMWTRSTAMNIADTLGNCHVWGCPIFVLEPKLRKNGVKIPRWAPRSRQGVNLGFSRLHSSLVALVLHPTTKSITTQFHVVFDDAFSTVPHNGEIDPKSWQSLITVPQLESGNFHNARLQTHLDPSDNPGLADEWLTHDERLLRNHRRRQAAALRHLDPLSRPVAPLPQMEKQREGTPSNQEEGVPIPQDNSLSPRQVPTSVVRSPTVTVVPATSLSPPTTIPYSADTPSGPPPMSSDDQMLRRSSRTRAPPVLFQPDMGAASRWKSDMVVNLAETLNHGEWTLAEAEDLRSFLAEFDNEECSRNPVQALAATKKPNDPDTPSVWDALSSEDSETWMDAMRAEIKSLQDRKTWNIVERSSAGNKHVIPGTWSMKKKRYPDGRFRKFKARWCKRGDIERRKAGPTLDNYSPVVAWATVRMMLLLGLFCGLQTTQVDYTNAFAQADLPEHEYMELPQYFKKELSDGFNDPIIELNKSLYGGALAAKHWFTKLSQGLTERGFRQSALDKCLFVRSDMIIVVYIDDCIHWYKDQEVMDAFVQSLTDDGDSYNWEHTVEGAVSAFLGIDIHHHVKNNRYKLTQTGLVDKILEATNLKDCNSKPTPCSPDGKTLGSDKNGPAAEQDWNYASIIGMLLYLAGNSRPDIAFAVHQAARFTHAPKASHEKAVIRICRYLKGTRNEGLVLQPSRKLKVDCYVDADFGGLFGAEDPLDPMCAKSRTGFVIMLANCPLVWASKLQTTIALSTQNAEYVALSQSLRELVHLRELLLDLMGTLGLGTDVAFETKSKAFEDNAAALQFAKTGKLTLQNKHIATKYHWFRSHLQSDSNPTGWLEIDKVESDQQAADIFTKNLTHEKFTAARQLLCGW
jgi:hypothetical protein